LCAIGDVYQEAITISYGVGSNGKSTFWNSIAGAMGSYSGMISADALTVGCRRNVKPELAEVKGKRVLIAAELEEGMRLSTSIVKQLSSTDEIEGEKKYKDPFKFKPTHTLVLYTNHLPKVGAMDTGIWRRLIVIPFNATIMGNSEIKNYSKYLLDNAGPYIVKWIIEGAQKAIAANFKLVLPQCVKDAIAKYKSDNDWMSHFLDECCEQGADYEERSGELYTNYRAFCTQSGEYCRSTTEFYAALDQRGFVRRKRSKGVFVCGLRLAADDELPL
ncbi:MAG: DNA primase, partial [Oscillospiraceae bacterium]|nr:DNA primase [Oscillospiraceae bacterium]